MLTGALRRVADKLPEMQAVQNGEANDSSL